MRSVEPADPRRDSWISRWLGATACERRGSPAPTHHGHAHRAAGSPGSDRCGPKPSRSRSLAADLAEIGPRRSSETKSTRRYGSGRSGQDPSKHRPMIAITVRAERSKAGSAQPRARRRSLRSSGRRPPAPRLPPAQSCQRCTITSQYFGSSSTSRAWRPVFSHAISVEPEPPNGSARCPGSCWSSGSPARPAPPASSSDGDRCGPACR